jgi:hypothetical protein
MLHGRPAPFVLSLPFLCLSYTMMRSSVLVTVMLQCCYSVVTVLLQCCYSVLTTVFLHCCYNALTLLLHCCYNALTLLLHCCYTVSRPSRKHAESTIMTLRCELYNQRNQLCFTCDKVCWHTVITLFTLSLHSLHCHYILYTVVTLFTLSLHCRYTVVTLLDKVTTHLQQHICY